MNQTVGLAYFLTATSFITACSFTPIASGVCAGSTTLTSVNVCFLSTPTTAAGRMKPAYAGVLHPGTSAPDTIRFLASKTRWAPSGEDAVAITTV